MLMRSTNNQTPTLTPIRCLRALQKQLNHQLAELQHAVTPDAVHAVRTLTRRMRVLLRAYEHEFLPAPRRQLVGALC